MCVSTYWALVNHQLFIFLTLAIIPMLFFVRFKKVALLQDRIEYKEWSIMPFLNEQKTWFLSDITRVKTFDGYFDKRFFIADIFFSTFFRGNTRPPEMTFYLDNDQPYTIVKFGNESKFRRLSKKIKTIANNK